MGWRRISVNPHKENLQFPSGLSRPTKPLPKTPFVQVHLARCFSSAATVAGGAPRAHIPRFPSVPLLIRVPYDLVLSFNKDTLNPKPLNPKPLNPKTHMAKRVLLRSLDTAKWRYHGRSLSEIDVCTVLHEQIHRIRCGA